MGVSRPQERRQQPPKRLHPLKPQSPPVRSALTKTTQNNMASILKLLPHSRPSTQYQQSPLKQATTTPPVPPTRQSPISTSTPGVSPHVQEWLNTQLTSTSPNYLLTPTRTAATNPTTPPTLYLFSPSNLQSMSPTPIPTPLSALHTAITTSREAETLHAYDVGVIAALQSMLIYWNSRASAMQTSVAERRIFLREAQRLAELMDDAERDMLISNADLVAKQGVEEKLWETVTAGNLKFTREGEMMDEDDWAVAVNGGLQDPGRTWSVGDSVDSWCDTEIEDIRAAWDLRMPAVQSEILPSSVAVPLLRGDEDEEMEDSEYEDVERIEIESGGSECDWID